MNIMKSILNSLVIVSLMFFAAQTQALADETSIAVAANFTGVTNKLVPLFEKATGHQVKVSFGSTGKLYAQIENGAPFDVFLAADSTRPAKAEKEGLAVPGSQFVYAQGQLALWSARSGLFSAGDDYLRTGKFDHVALANPKTAPYGLAATQVMQNLGVASSLQSKLVQGDSIAQTFQFVATGNAEIGFVAYSQVIGWKGEAGSSWVIPVEYYDPIEQSAVLLKRGESNAAAKAFLNFVKTDPAALAVIAKFGYRVK
jgi:molybdate transport system substrate-binding protein